MLRRFPIQLFLFSGLAASALAMLSGVDRPEVIGRELMLLRRSVLGRPSPLSLALTGAAGVGAADLAGVEDSQLLAFSILGRESALSSTGARGGRPGALAAGAAEAASLADVAAASLVDVNPTKTSCWSVEKEEYDEREFCDEKEGVLLSPAFALLPATAEEGTTYS